MECEMLYVLLYFAILETAYWHGYNCFEWPVQRIFLHYFKPKFYSVYQSDEMVVEKLKKTIEHR